MTQTKTRYGNGKTWCLRRRRKKPPRPESRAVAFARFATPLLKKEHDYLTRPERVVRVDVPRTSTAHKVTGDHADMARYWAFTDTPRPESFREDAALAAAAFPEGADPDGEKARRLFRDVASAAESGHDFASRWLGDHEQALGASGGTWACRADSFPVRTSRRRRRRRRRSRPSAPRASFPPTSTR